MGTPRGSLSGSGLELTASGVSQSASSFADEDYHLVHASEILDEEAKSDAEFSLITPLELIDMEQHYIGEGKNKLIRHNVTLHNKVKKPIHFIFSNEMLDQLSLPPSTEEKAGDQQRKLQLMQRIAMGLLTRYTAPYRLRNNIAFTDEELTRKKLAITSELEESAAEEPVRFVIASAKMGKDENQCEIVCSREMDGRTIEDALTIPLPTSEQAKRYKFFIPSEIDNHLADGIHEVKLDPLEHYEGLAGINPKVELELAPILAPLFTPVSAPVAVSSTTQAVNSRLTPVRDADLDSFVVISKPREARPELTATEVLFARVCDILSKQQFWDAQGIMSSGAPDRIQKMQKIAKSGDISRFLLIGNHARQAVDVKKWYEGCLFSQPIFRANATHDFYKAMRNAVTNPNLALTDLDRWEEKYQPNHFKESDYRYKQYLPLTGGRF